MGGEWDAVGSEALTVAPGLIRKMPDPAPGLAKVNTALPPKSSVWSDPVSTAPIVIVDANKFWLLHD